MRAKWYFTGLPCVHGHVAHRRTNNNVCVACEQMRRNFLPRGVTTHGLTGTTEHNIWCGIRRRCLNPNDGVYADYGGRGIRICERWSSFAKFLDDMGARPSSRHSIERRNNNGHYEPGNCYWATRLQQSRNRRGNVYLTYRGKTRCVTEWAERLELTAAAIRMRLRRGASPARALRTAAKQPSRGANHG